MSGTPRRLHPLHAALLAFTIPLFVGGLISDLAYWSTFHVQWANFSSWLIAGGLFVGAFVVALGVVRSLPKANRAKSAADPLFRRSSRDVGARLHQRPRPREGCLGDHAGGLYLSAVTTLLAARCSLDRLFRVS